MCAHGALQWTGVPSGVYSCLVPSVLGIGSGFTVALSRINHLLKQNVCLLVRFMDQISQVLLFFWCVAFGDSGNV